MEEEKSFDFAINLDDLKLIDTFFHVNQPKSTNLQSKLAVSVPRRQREQDDANGRHRLHALVSVQFLLFNDAAPEELTPDNVAEAVISFGAAMDISVSCAYMGKAIPGAKHSTASKQDIELARNKRMEDNMLLEALRCGYAFASSRMLEVSSLSPLGAIPMPLVDADALLRDIDQNQ